MYCPIWKIIDLDSFGKNQHIGKLKKNHQILQIRILRLESSFSLYLVS